MFLSFSFWGHFEVPAVSFRGCTFPGGKRNTWEQNRKRNIPSASKHLLRRYLNLKNLPKILCEQVFGRLGITKNMLSGLLMVYLVVKLACIVWVLPSDADCASFGFLRYMRVGNECPF